MVVDFKQYRRHMLYKNKIDGVKLMKLCITNPVYIGELIYRTLEDIYPDNIEEACQSFKAPMAIYSIEESALKKYLRYREENEHAEE